MPDGTALVRFSLARDALCDENATVDTSAGIAQNVVHNSTRRRALLRVRASGLRRIDLWRSDDGLCAHNMVDDPTAATGGAVALAPFQESYLAALVTELFGALPSDIAPESLVIPSEAFRNPSLVPEQGQLIACWDSGGSTRRLVAAVTAAGVFGAWSEQLGESVELTPWSATQLWSALRREVLDRAHVAE